MQRALTEGIMSMSKSGIVPYLFCDDAETMVNWYSRVFGFVELSRWRDPQGKITNAEMAVGETELWLDGDGPAYWEKHGRGPAPWMGVWVDDVDAMCHRVRSEGVEIDDPVDREFGVRMTGEVIDPQGYRWSFMQRFSFPAPSS